MGFMGLGCICDSDCASDFVFTAVGAMVDVCKKELKDEANCYNTPGYINIALFVDEVLNQNECYSINENEDLLKVVYDAKVLLEKNQVDWSENGFKQDIKRLIDACDTFINKSESGWEYVVEEYELEV